MTARRRYAAISFLTWLPTGLYIPPMVLLMLDRGLTLPTIAAVSTAYSVVVALLELPTGGLADVLGRRPVLIASAIASMISFVLFGFATTTAIFVASGVLRGAARALSTGPAEAWYVDTVHALDGPDADLGPGLARGSMAGSIALTIGTLAGGLLPLVLVGRVPVPLAVPIFIAAGVEAVRLVMVLVAMPEPLHQRARVRTMFKGMSTSVLSDGVIARILLVAGGTGVALATIELLTPAWLATLTGAFETAGIAYAVVAALGFAAGSLGNGLSMRLVRMTGGPGKGAAVGLLVMAVALVGLAGTTVLTGLTGVAAAAVAYFVIFVGLGAAIPAISTMLHARIEAQQRATVISMQSLSLQLSGAAGALAFAWVAAKAGPALAFALCAVVMAGSALLIRSRDMSVLFAKLSR